MAECFGSRLGPRCLSPPHDFLTWLLSDLPPSSVQQFAIVSDPKVAQHILKDNAKAYSKVRFTDL